MLKKLITTIAVLAIAGYFTYDNYSSYIENPWTRDGQIRADIIQITPRVTGPVIELNVLDNSHVKKGDVLFKIDLAPLRQQKTKHTRTYFKLRHFLNALSMKKSVLLNWNVVSQALYLF